MENQNNYFALPDEYSTGESSRVAIVPVPYALNSNDNSKVMNTPGAVLKASQKVELFDEELWVEPYKIGIQGLAPLSAKSGASATNGPFMELAEVVSPLIEIGKFPIILGSDNCLSLGAIPACAAKFKNLSILQIDAHAGCRDSYNGSPYSHATVTYHMYKALPKPIITQVGIRDISASEVSWLEEEKPNINIYWARHQDKWNFQDIIATLSENVYLSIDVDALDSSLMPSTSTPEPGGMNWYQLTGLIKTLCIRKNVVAADIVGLVPTANFAAPDFLVAKLIYKLVGYKYALELGVTKKYL